MKAPDLKHCPFCGGEAMLMLKDKVYWYVTCNSCSAGTEGYIPSDVYPWAAYDAIQDAVNKAVEAWNRRANDDT